MGTKDDEYDYLFKGNLHSSVDFIYPDINHHYCTGNAGFITDVGSSETDLLDFIPAFLHSARSNHHKHVFRLSNVLYSVSAANHINIDQFVR